MQCVKRASDEALGSFSPSDPPGRCCCHTNADHWQIKAADVNTLGLDKRRRLARLAASFHLPPGEPAQAVVVVPGAARRS